ncbi:hypothetical protein F4Z98_13175 [Candidatus Poribacteria bacterium]|nr:hypothetical protein [Candidatus Poribacteria bacterium]
MRKLQVKRSSFLIEPANRSIQTFVGARSPRPSTCRGEVTSLLLETLGEILSILSIFIIGWIAYVVL